MSRHRKHLPVAAGRLPLVSMARRRGWRSLPVRPFRSFRVVTSVLLIGIPAVLVAALWWAGWFAWCPLRWAELANRDGDFAQSRYWLRVAGCLGGDRATVNLMAARTARKQFDTEGFQRCLAEARRALVDSRRVRKEIVLATAAVGRLEEVEDEILLWLRAADEDAAEVCDAYANGLARLGRLPEVQLLLTAWERDHPADPRPHVRRGRIAEHALDWVAAEREYRSALDRAPAHAAALFALGRVLLYLRRPADALAALQRCREQAPEADAVVDVAVAGCLSSLGDPAAARALLLRVLALDPETRRRAARRVEDHPVGDPAARQLGQLELDAGNLPSAEGWLRRAVEADEHDLDARYALGMTLQRLGRDDEARAELERVAATRKALADLDPLQDALARNPADVAARLRIGRAYLEHRSEAEGVYWLRTALAYDPNYVPAHEALADHFERKMVESEQFRILAEHHRREAQAASAP